MVTAAEITQQAGPYVTVILGWVVVFAQIIGILLGVLYVVMLLRFNTKVIVREYTKGGRTVIKIHRARKTFDKINKHPQIQFFGFMGFGGERTDQPPANCIFPYKSGTGNKIIYDFTLKDGTYYPIANAVLGKIQQGPDGNEYYTLQGTGLEVSRDFQSDLATLNRMTQQAEKFRNKNPAEVAAMYGLMIIVVIGSFVIISYAIYKTGQISEAVNQGWDQFGQMSELLRESKQGPG